MERALLRGRRGRNHHLPENRREVDGRSPRASHTRSTATKTGWRCSINGPRFLILAVDQSNRLYGFTEQAIGENLPQMHVSVIFYPKEKGKRFLKGKWIMCNDFYTPPLEAQYIIEPYVETTEGGDARAAHRELKAYAYAVDTTDVKAWPPTTTPRWASSPRRRSGDQAQPDGHGLARLRNATSRMTVSGTPLMVIVADTRNRRYAYSRQDIDLSGGRTDLRRGSPSARGAPTRSTSRTAGASSDETNPESTRTERQNQTTMNIPTYRARPSGRRGRPAALLLGVPEPLRDA